MLLFNSQELCSVFYRQLYTALAAYLVNCMSPKKNSVIMKKYRMSPVTQPYCEEEGLLELTRFSLRLYINYGGFLIVNIPLEPAPRGILQRGLVCLLAIDPNGLFFFFPT